MLITSPHGFFVFVLILVGSSGNQNTPPAPPASSETPCCMRAADADYRFTLWPRKQLIAYAEAAWHLTIHYSERDDWIAHISVMEHPLYCICEYVCVAVHAYSVEYIIIILQKCRYSRLAFFHWNLQLALSGVIILQIYGSQPAIFKCNIKMLQLYRLEL